MTTSHDYREFVLTITYQPREPAYTVDFPDIPDIITSGETLAEAFRHACEALDHEASPRGPSLGVRVSRLLTPGGGRGPWKGDRAR